MYCVLLERRINGDAPAFADLFGSMRHPLVMITTLLWGVVARLIQMFGFVQSSQLRDSEDIMSAAMYQEAADSTDGA